MQSYIIFDNPLAWPLGKARTDEHQSGTFKVGQGEALQSLVDELNRLGGDSFITADWDLGSRDGWPLASQRAGRDPGVAIRITRKGKHFNLACDKYDKHWKNARALAQIVEGLRSMERHGAEFLEQALGGFTELPPASSSELFAGQSRTWWDVLGVKQESPWEIIESAKRTLAKAVHPDKGGTTAQMTEINLAFDQAKKERKK